MGLGFRGPGFPITPQTFCIMAQPQPPSLERKPYKPCTPATTESSTTPWASNKYTIKMGNQMEKQMEDEMETLMPQLQWRTKWKRKWKNEMETGPIRGLYRDLGIQATPTWDPSL